jgi:hypothetical protein
MNNSSLVNKIKKNPVLWNRGRATGREKESAWFFRMIPFDGFPDLGICLAEEVGH